MIDLPIMRNHQSPPPSPPPDSIFKRDALATARALAEHGATLVLVSRNQEALDVLAEECRAKGGRALAIRADVGRNEDMERVAQLTIETFGGFDTWRINAGCSTPTTGAWCTGP